MEGSHDITTCHLSIQPGTYMWNEMNSRCAICTSHTVIHQQGVLIKKTLIVCSSLLKFYTTGVATSFRSCLLDLLWSVPELKSLNIGHCLVKYLYSQSPLMPIRHVNMNPHGPRSLDSIDYPIYHVYAPLMVTHLS